MGFDSAKPRNRSPFPSVIDLGGHARYKLIDLFCPVRSLAARAPSPPLLTEMVARLREHLPEFTQPIVNIIAPMFSTGHVVEVEVVVGPLPRLFSSSYRPLNCPLRNEGRDL